ncbi:MAG: cyclic nucleotide-binding domain-containing protein [Planctomycetia bacterium]|nr:cyclic nucleotide-binding domain-containing protein [Planctomycetia bacterium]
MVSKRIPIKTLQQIPAFRNFNETECRQLVDIAQEKAFAPGEKVVEQGKSSQNLWILLEGQCEVVKESQRDGAVVLATLEAFNLFGEMSFFSPAPHSANVLAKTPVKLLCISRTDYDDMIHEGVGAAYKLAYNVVENVANRLRRMDEWVAALTAGGEHFNPAEKLPEWRRFRDKLFDGWNL